MDRRNVIAGVVVLVGVPILVWWAFQTADPRATINGIGSVLAVGMAALVVVSLVMDPKHFAQAGPHRLWFPTTLVAQGLGVLSSLSGEYPSIPIALAMSMVATVILWVRSRRHERPETRASAR